MKERQEFSAFDNFDGFKKIAESNRQNAYENKICRKLLKRLVDKNSEDYGYWENRLKESDEPLMDMQELFHPFRLYSQRLQTWSINDLLKSPSKLLKTPLWQEFAIVLDQCQRLHKDVVPAMVFYNSAIGQDMVIHIGETLAPPDGHVRIMRTSSTGEGVVIIDTLEGFLKILGATDNEV